MSEQLTKADTKPVYNSAGQLVKFTIKRSKWGKKRLLLDDQKSGCCMGHYGLACGVTTNLLHNRAFLYDAGSINVPLDHSWLDDQAKLSSNDETLLNMTSHQPYWSNKFVLSTVNDTDSISAPDKERLIKTLFAAQGITVHFED
jgi:hypothetical protein